MSDEQHERDLSVIETARELVNRLPPRPFKWVDLTDNTDTPLNSTLSAADGTFIINVEYYDGPWVSTPHGADITGDFLAISGEFADAALREIDRLTIDLHFRNSQLDDERNENDILRTSRNTVIERWGAMFDIVPDHLRGQTPADIMLALIAERDAARAELAKLRGVIVDEDIIGSYIEARAFDVEIRHGEYGKEEADEHKQVAAALRAALKSESSE